MPKFRISFGMAEKYRRPARTLACGVGEYIWFSDRAADRSGGRDEKVPDGAARKSAPYG